MVLKFGLDQIHSFGDIVIFIFYRFGLKLPIYAHFWGVLGAYFSQMTSPIILTPKGTSLGENTSFEPSVCTNWRHHTWLLTVCRSPRWRAEDIFDLLRPAASLSLGQELHLAEGTSQSLEQQFGTIFRPICDSTRSHCCHLDKN